jgi:hypothetical protein
LRATLAGTIRPIPSKAARKLRTGGDDFKQKHMSSIEDELSLGRLTPGINLCEHEVTALGQTGCEARKAG